MSEIPPTHEPVTRSAVFEHAFPGNKWDDLKPFDVRNADFFIRELLPSPSNDRSANFGEAVKNKQGFAARLDLPHPDKASLSWALLEATPTNENINTVRGWISDLLNNDERLGGVCVKPMSWLKSDGLVSTATAMVQGADLYEIGAAMIVGVLDKTGGAKAIITFHTGERPRKGVKEKQSILAVKPTPVPIASGI